MRKKQLKRLSKHIIDTVCCYECGSLVGQYCRTRTGEIRYAPHLCRNIEYQCATKQQKKRGKER